MSTARWSIQAIDTRLNSPDQDLEALAGDLGLPVTQVEAFARLRRILLAGRANSYPDHTALQPDDLHAAGVSIAEVLAYLHVAERIHQLRAAEQPTRPIDRDRPRRVER